MATGGPAWPRSERGGQEHRVSCCPGLRGAGGGRGLGARGSDVTRLCDVVTSLLGSLQERLSVWDPPEESRGWTRARFQESFWRPPLEDHSSAGKGHSLQPPRRSLFCHQGRAWAVMHPHLRKHLSSSSAARRVARLPSYPGPTDCRHNYRPLYYYYFFTDSLTRLTSKETI